ncbi:MAG: shikimate kinase [Cyclobacteriaceae bacterium]|nr:shikimate kinase [Cyclobacteriaceae bacterium]
MKIFLIGLPGSGKTTLGKQAAHQLSIPFVDLDAAIEKAEQRTIPEIFKQSGENYFRQLESELLKKWAASSTDFLMATGGGAPCFFDNVELMNRAGITFFLDVPAMEIAQRISASTKQERPLFNSMDFDVLKDQIETLRSRRISFYKQAQQTLSGRGIQSQQLVEMIRKGIQA